MQRIRHISLIAIIFFIALFISYHIYYYFVDNVNNELVREYIEEEKIISTNNVEKINTTVKDKIIGVLEIPKINLKRGFYNISSKENDVNKNIIVLKESSMPDAINSALYLAAHSGNSPISFFQNIDLLKINDQIIIHYQNKKFNYVVSDIYETDKTGYINVNKNIHENILVLTTCSKKESKQLIVKAKLIK